MRANAVWALCASVLAGSALLALPWHSATDGQNRSATADTTAPFHLRHASLGDAPASPDARRIANWVAYTGDNGSSDFIIVDKKFARLYVFGADAVLRATTMVLLGAAVGDDSVPGIGTRPIAEVRVHERTTPAGRFVGERGHNTLGHDVVWVDYDAAVSIHRVITTQPSENRLQRLATARVDDKRISYGCINVPVAFYETYIRPVFATWRAPIYVLPEVKTVQQVFGIDHLTLAKGSARLN